eukprot:TsM_000306600 transcript=TsM_000306600 gene=TsM_000306600
MVRTISDFDTKESHQFPLCPSPMEQSNVAALCKVKMKSAPKRATGASTQNRSTYDPRPNQATEAIEHVTWVHGSDDLALCAPNVSRRHE